MAFMFVETEEFNHTEPEYVPIEAELAQTSEEKCWWNAGQFHDQPSLIMRLFKKSKPSS